MPTRPPSGSRPSSRLTSFAAAALIASGVLLTGCDPAATSVPSNGGSPGTASASPGPAGIGLTWGAASDDELPDGSTGLAGIDRGIVVTSHDSTTWSADGVAWEPIEGGPDGLVVAAGGPGFVALGDGSFWASIDGRSWSRTPVPDIEGLRISALTAAGDGFLALGSAGEEATDRLIRSADGAAWSVTIPFGAEQRMNRLAAAGPIAVAFSLLTDDQGRLVGWSSSDFGATWTPIAAAAAPDGSVGGVVPSRDGTLLAFGWPADNAVFRSRLWASADGRQWNAVPTGTTFDGADLHVLVHTRWGWIAGGTVLEPRTGAFWWSADGVAWERAPEVPSFELGSPTAIVGGPRGPVALGTAGFVGSRAVWVSPPVESEPLPTGTWTAAPELPEPAAGVAAMASDGSLLSFGDITVATGDQGPTITRSRTTRALDPSGSAWSERAPMPRERHGGIAATSPAGEVWLLGGYEITDAGEAADILASDICDPAADRWRDGPPLPKTFVGGLDATFLADGRLVVVGRTQDPTKAELWVLAPSGSSWSQIGTVDWRDGPFDIAASGDDLLMVGIVREGEHTAAPRLVRLDPATGAAQELARPTIAVWPGSLMALPDGRFALLGGALAAFDSGGGIALRRVDVYDPAADRWSYLTSMPEARAGGGVAVGADGRIWVVGGEPVLEDVAPPRPTSSVFVWAP